MKFPRRKFLHLAAGAAALPAVSRLARAQPYPSRPVRLIVPGAAQPVALLRPLPDAEIVGGEVSSCPPFPSLDHLVGAGEKGWWHVQAQRPRGLEVDRQHDLRRLLHR